LNVLGYSWGEVYLIVNKYRMHCTCTLQIYEIPQEIINLLDLLGQRFVGVFKHMLDLYTNKHYRDMNTNNPSIPTHSEEGPE
jgi:hypothetical protein